MISPFRFSKIPAIIIKAGSLSELPRLASGFGKNVALITGSSSFSSSPSYPVLIHALAHEGITHDHIKIPGEPSPEMIDDAVVHLRGKKTDVVVAIGGGSVLDAGKAISAMINIEGSVIDFLEDVGKKQHPGTKIPFIAVPTTSGTGSEATKNAVISRTGSGGFKKSLRHDNFVPDIALVDPELTLDCPSALTAASGMDCFTQLTEAYLSTKSNPYTDALAIEGLKAVKDSLVKSCLNGKNIEARTGMSFAALTSGICLANAGLGTVHGFASAIGGQYNIPHGVICGTLMAITNEINVRKLWETNSSPAALKKYANLGRIFLEKKNMSDDYYINGFIDYLNELTVMLNLPGLKSLGLSEDAVERISAASDNKNNPVNLNKKDLAEIIYGRLV
jgi:alcohol dehydrogenase class IV